MPDPGGSDLEDLIDAVDPVVDAALAEAFESVVAYRSAIAEVRSAAGAYYGGPDLVMDDAAYDALMARVAATEAAHPQWKLAQSPTEAIAAGAGVVGDVEHSTPMLSLDNVFDEDTLRRWAARLQRLLGQPAGGVTGEPKIDGLAVAARYGDGEPIPHSAAMARLAGLGVATTGGSPAGMPLCPTIDEVIAAVEALHARRGALGFGVDGAVIKADQPADREKAGFSSRAPRWGIAYKFPADTRTTRLLRIEVQVGRTGVITPVAVLEPVVVGGGTVTSATLHNFDDLLRRDLRAGDTVFVRRAGDVIPEVTGARLDDRPADAVPFEPPTVCPRLRRRHRPVTAADAMLPGPELRLARVPGLLRRPGLDGHRRPRRQDHRHARRGGGRSPHPPP